MEKFSPFLPFPVNIFVPELTEWHETDRAIKQSSVQLTRQVSQIITLNMSCSCIHTIQFYPSYVNNVIMYQTKRGHVRLNISVKEAEFETWYQLWTSTGTCAQRGSALPEEGTRSLAKIKCASTPISCLGGERQGKRHTRKEAYYSKDPVLQSATVPLANVNSRKERSQTWDLYRQKGSMKNL